MAICVRVCVCIISKMKTEPTIWENIFSSDTSHKCLTFKLYKNSHDSTAGRQTTQLKDTGTKSKGGVESGEGDGDGWGTGRDEKKRHTTVLEQ